MPRPPTLKIIEIFPSVQGEGLRQGEATIFIRLSGCNLRCSFCDTKYAWKGGHFHSEIQALDKVNRLSKNFPADWVCLTGGEPLLQDIGGLVRGLKKEKLKVQVETNGTLYRSLPVDWYSVSPKPPRYVFRPEYKKRAAEVKLVVTWDLGFNILSRLRRELPEQTPILLQPLSNRKASFSRASRLLRQAVKAGIKNVRLSIQLHKVFGLR